MQTYSLTHSLSHPSPEMIDWLLSHVDYKRFLAELRLAQPKKLLAALTAGGFTLNETTLQKKQSTLRAALLKSSTEYLLLLIATAKMTDTPWQALYHLLEKLPAETFKHCWRSFLDEAAEPAFILLALSMFAPEDWRTTLAMRLVKIPSLWKSRTQPQNPSRKPQFLTPRTLSLLARIFTTASSDAVPHPVTDTPAVTMDSAAERQKLREEIQQQLAVEKRKKDAVAKETVQKLADANRQIDRLKQQLRDLQQTQENERRTALEQQQRLFDETFQTFIGETLQTSQNLQTETVSSQIAVDELVYKLENETQKLITYNRNAGSRSQLRQQREALQTALDNLQTVLKDSFHAPQGLNELITQTQTRIAAINERLNDGETTLPQVSQLECAIQAVPHNDQANETFGRLASLIEMAHDFDMLSSDDASALHAVIARRRSSFHKTHEKQTELTARTAPDAPRVHTPMQILQILTYINHLPRVTLMVDGYNVIKRNEPWKTFDGQNFKDARYKFTQYCIKNAAPFKRFNLFFDGGEQTRIIEKPLTNANMRVIYSAKTDDDQNADNEIVKFLESERSMRTSEDIIWLVTDDSGLCQRCNDFIDAIVPTQFFLAFLK